MADKKTDNIYDVKFNLRDDEIRKLELLHAQINEDLNDIVREYVKISGNRNLSVKKSKKFTKLLRDGERTFKK